MKRYGDFITSEEDLRDSKIIQLWLGGNHLARLDVAQSYYPYTGNK